MSWLWGSSKPTNDATSNLDPSLRDFLEKETARTQAKTKPSPQTAPLQHQSNDASREYSSQLGLPVPGARHAEQFKPPVEHVRTSVPEESQFKDGRYADLWRTYRSQEELAATATTDHEKLNQILHGFKDRKAAIGRAAIDNCVVEQIAQYECFSSGSYRDLATMCNKQGKAFNRCYQMQARFLKALGYLSVPRTVEEEERIQTHADYLYQQMMQREKHAQEAKEKGVPVEHAGPLLDGEQTVKALGADSNYAHMRQRAQDQPILTDLSAFPKEVRESIREKVKDMTPDERELELQLLAHEARVSRELRTLMSEHWDEELLSRRRRRGEGRETIGDKVKRYGGWRQ